MNKKTIFLTLIFLSELVLSQGKAGSVFLNINPGARSSGMGEAQIAIANDSYASFYNPAGLANITSNEFSFMHSKYMPNLSDDMSYDFISFSRPIDENSAIGGYFNYLDLGEQIAMDDSGVESGSFSSYMYTLNFSYAKRIDSSSSWGINSKYFFQELANVGNIDASAGGFALDLSYFHRNFLSQNNLNFGAVLSNIGNDLGFNGGEKDPLPLRLGIGISYTAFENKTIFALDLNQNINDENMISNFGIEHKIVENFLLRAGLINDSSSNITYSTFGFGMKYDSFGFDLSYLIGDELDPHSDMLRFSFSSAF
jgi:hypothetical protein